MFYKLSVQVTSKIQEYVYISDEDQEIYRYGIQQGMILLLNVVTTLIISIALEMLMDCLLYMIAFIPLRIFAGGYHAKTHIRCYVYSAIQIFAVLLTIKMLLDALIAYGAFAVVGSLSLIVFSPVEDVNKPLDEIEVVVYRKRMLIILLILISAMIIFQFIGFIRAAKAISMAILSVGILVLVGKINNINKSKGY